MNDNTNDSFRAQLDAVAMPQQKWIAPDGEPFPSYEDCVCYMCFMHILKDIIEPQGMYISRRQLATLLMNEEFGYTFDTFRRNLQESTSQISVLKQELPDPGELDVDALLKTLETQRAPTTNKETK